MSELKALESKMMESLLPSSRLVRAAVSGLMAVAAGGCPSDDNSDGDKSDGELTADEIDALCKDKVDDAVDNALASQDVEMLCSDMVDDAKKDCMPDEPDLTMLCTDMVEATKAPLETMVSDLQGDVADLQAQVMMLEGQVADGEATIAAQLERGRALLLTAEEKTTSSEQKEYTLAELTQLCDDRGGYIEVHSACGGHNSCAGFSYGDWGPGAATLTEHTCAAANGCLGLSCVDTAADQARTGKAIYEDEDYGDYGPGTCAGCHAWDDPDDSHNWSAADSPDLTKFVVFVQQGSTRTTTNWLDKTAEEQEREVAFGVKGVTPAGDAYSSMAPYHQYLSRAEIAAVVAYLRTLDPVIEYYRYPYP